MLLKARFRPYACAIELDGLTEVPSDRPILFFVRQGPASVCRTIRNKYPLFSIIAVGGESKRDYVRNALDDYVNAALLTSVSLHALVSAAETILNGGLIVTDGQQTSKQPRSCHSPSEISYEGESGGTRASSCLGARSQFLSGSSKEIQIGNCEIYGIVDFLKNRFVVNKNIKKIPFFY